MKRVIEAKKKQQIYTETVHYQIDDHLGSASIELNENAAIISCEEYHLPEDEASAKFSFGTTSYQKHNTDISQKRYKYVGKERDDETGLYYYGARYYAAWIGRWTAVDPMANERVWLNPYNYCQNNPINRTDPTGALDEHPSESSRPTGILTIENIHLTNANDTAPRIKNLKSERIAAIKILQELETKLKADPENKSIKESIEAFKKGTLTPLEKDIDKKTKYYNSQKTLGGELQKAIDENLSVSPSMKHNEFTAKLCSAQKGDTFDMIQEMRNYASSSGKDIKIRISVGETKTNEANGDSTAGNTSTYPHSTGFVSKILIDDGVMDIAKTLANELGDVYFDTVFSQSHNVDEVKKIKKEKPRTKESLRTTHDILYNRNVLDSRKFSDHVEKIFKTFR